jgi:hypothetical protein
LFGFRSNRRRARGFNVPRFIKGKRRQKRTKMVAPVRLWITGTSGNQESHLAHTLDVNDHGVRLAGFGCELKPEDMIELQYRHKRARFRVLWTSTPEGSREKRLGAECVEPQKDIWGVEFPEKVDEYEEKD